ncbi:MAG TPA: bifunctional serine/threonine-protein kinase/formylglycine-generating enzyme family protein, partial [Rudaea sp.]|nr:bifunctional serine/threonine-protein kinase/formylglycine-generating enzyme family protein [Rudaea sp.]
MIDIPGYIIKREIGAGGMATVHLATQTSLEREVALKVMSPALAADPTFSKRFLQEARMLASLAHPNIVAVYDVGVTPNQLHYFSMQYLPGGDLAGRVRSGIEERDLVIAIAGVARALGYAHQRGYVHRDVAPGNILYDANNNPVLTDFGIALAAASGSRITSAGFSVGTSHYMSPEQARGGDVDARSDIYSLGVLTYYGLVGKPPYDGSDGFAVAYAHVFEPVPRLPSEKAHWQPVIDRALAKDPKDRFANTEQFLDGLAAALPQYATLFRDDAPTPAPAPRPVAPAATTLVSMPAARPLGTDVPTKVPRSTPEPVNTSRAKNTPPSNVVAEKKPSSGLLRWWPVIIVVIGVALIAFAMFVRKPAPHPVTATTTPTPATTTPPPAPVSPAPTTPPPSTPSPSPANETPAVATNTPPPADTTPAPAAQTPPTAMDAVEASDAQAANTDQVQLADLPTVVDPLSEAIRLGRIDFAAQRLTSPAGNNALERFQLALKLDPKNKQARQGVVDVAKRYIDYAEKNRAQGDLASYERFLKSAADVAKTVPDDTEVPKAIAQVRQSAAAPFIAQGKTASGAGDKAAAKAAFEKAQQLDPDSDAAKEGLKYVATIGEPGFAFRDKMGDGQGPELVIMDARMAMAKHDVTRGEFRRFWNAVGKSQFPEGSISCRDRESLFRSSKKRTWENPDIQQDDTHPVVCVSWEEAATYAQWLSKQTGKHYRLMSPAEFDSVVRKAPNGACKSNLADASFNKKYDTRDGTDCDDGFAGTAPVGHFGAVAGGIADIDGNVRTWVGACGNGSVADVGSRCRDFLVKGRSWLS